MGKIIPKILVKYNSPDLKQHRALLTFITSSPTERNLWNHAQSKKTLNIFFPALTEFLFQCFWI